MRGVRVIYRSSPPSAVLRVTHRFTRGDTNILVCACNALARRCPYVMHLRVFLLLLRRPSYMFVQCACVVVTRQGSVNGNSIFALLRNSIQFDSKNWYRWRVVGNGVGRMR